MSRLTFTQSEQLKIGERGEYIPGPITAERAKRLDIKCWLDKRKAQPSESDKALREFVDLSYGYKLVYGITYKGKDFDCGDMPRDLNRIIQGIDIATNL